MTFDEIQQRLEPYEEFRKPDRKPRAGSGQWRDESNVELLKKLWIAGLSASQIAARIGGVTRNAVIGKVHRLRLSGRVTPTRKVTRPKRRESFTDLGALSGNPHTVRSAADRLDGALGVKIGKIVPRVYAEPEEHTAAMAAADTPPPQAKMVKLLDLEPHHCRWPIGDARTADFGFCGCTKAPVGSYCEHHAKMATVVMPRRTNNPFLLPNIRFKARKNEPLDDLPTKAA